MVPSELTLGTWGLSGDGYGAVEPGERDRTIDRALELGVTAFETADVYGHGTMEQVIGERVGSTPGTCIITKIGTVRPPPGSGHEIARGVDPPRSDASDAIAQVVRRFEPAYLREAVRRCQERLRRAKIDVVLLHQPGVSTLTRGEAAGAMSDLEREGAIGAWGVSAGDDEVARAALAQGARVVEVAYNVFFSRQLLDLAAAITGKKAGVLARSVLAYGLLAGRISASQVFPAGDHRSERWTHPELRARVAQLDAIRPLVGGEIPTMRAAALRFVLSNEIVSTAVLGPRSAAQLEQLVQEAGGGPPYLSEAAMTRLSADLARLGVIT